MSAHPMGRQVLIVEDEQELARILKRHLEDLGCTVQTAFAGDTGLKLAESKPFDLMLLDIMLPGLDGLEVCRRLRPRRVYTPILMLTARVKAIFRRVDAQAEEGHDATRLLRFGEVFSIDPRSRKVLVRRAPITITHKEFDLLLHLARNPGRVYTRTQLLDAVWGCSHEGYEHAINCHINRLRAKIECDPTRPEILQTVWGVGYKLAPEPEPTPTS